MHLGSQLVVLDNVAHFFGGNENIRSEVVAFVHLLNRLALIIDGSVLLVGHPNKAGGRMERTISGLTSQCGAISSNSQKIARSGRRLSVMERAIL